MRTIKLNPGADEDIADGWNKKNPFGEKRDEDMTRGEKFKKQIMGQAAEDPEELSDE